jgi:hypothetical protein
MDKVHEPSDSECYAPSSEPFKYYMQLYISFLSSRWKTRLKKTRGPSDRDCKITCTFEFNKILTQYELH